MARWCTIPISTFHALRLYAKTSPLTPARPCAPDRARVHLPQAQSLVAALLAAAVPGGNPGAFPGLPQAFGALQPLQPLQQMAVPGLPAGAGGTLDPQLMNAVVQQASAAAARVMAMPPELFANGGNPLLGNGNTGAYGGVAPAPPMQVGGGEVRGRVVAWCPYRSAVVSQALRLHEEPGTGSWAALA